MTVHHLDPGPGTTIDFFCRDTPAVLTVDPGDTVIVRSLDASGFLERQQTPGEIRPTMFAQPLGHCLTGPIAVRGAEPGMALALRIQSLRPDPWGWTVAAARDNPLNRRLGLTDLPPSWLLWEIDADTGTATDQRGHRVRIDPFLGVMGVAPAEPGEHSTIPATRRRRRQHRLPQPGRRFDPVPTRQRVGRSADARGRSLARQGDGEVSGTAIECAMTTRAVLDLDADPVIPGIHAETPTGRITFGFDEDLNEAMAQALDAMLGWMQVLYGLDKAAAMALASPSVDLRVTQVANDVWGVHALLPTGAIS